jgi:hypothetical protein
MTDKMTSATETLAAPAEAREKTRMWRFKESEITSWAYQDNLTSLCLYLNGFLSLRILVFF